MAVSPGSFKTMAVYVVKTEELTAKNIEAMYAVLPGSRQDCAARLAKPVKRVESVAAAYLAFFSLVCGDIDDCIVYPSLESLLEMQEEAAKLASKIGWHVGEYGKPFPQGVDVNGKLFYVSISHSGGLVVAAVAENPVGVDVQQNPALSKHQMLRIASKFHASEQEHLNSLPESQLSAEFCRLWVCKESVMKLCGKGLSLPISSFRIVGDSCMLDGNPIRLTVHPLQDTFLAIAEWK